MRLKLEISMNRRIVLDCEKVRCNMRALVVNEAHLIVEWQVIVVIY